MTEIDDLLDRIQSPPADVAADVSRGEQALRHRHRWQVAAAALSVVALTGVGVAVTGSHGSSGAGPGLAGRGTAPSTPKAHHGSAVQRHHLADQKAKRAARRALTGMSSQDAIRTYHDVLAEHLDPGGDLLAPSTNEQGGSQTLGSKFDWNHGGMLEIVVGKRWTAAAGFYLLENAGMQPTTYDGHPARVSTRGDDVVVSVQHGDGTVVTLIASSSFGNNGTSGSTTALTQHRLLDAAADPRLVLPGDVQ